MSNSPTLLRRSQLGELLVAEGKLTREELAAALAYREERGLKLGQALVALHLLTQHELAGALRSQGRVHCLHLTPGIVDPDVARLLPESMARQYVAIPVHRVAGRITVAMEDPAEEYDVDAISVALGEPVFAVHADPERILQVIQRLHGANPEPAQSSQDAPRFTLVRGPLPDTDPDEAAEMLVRAALREARAIGADSFHVEATARGAEMSFRVDGARTPAARLTTDWADACARAALHLAGAGPDSERATGSLDIEEDRVAIDVATILGIHGRCTRIALRTQMAPLAPEHLPVELEQLTSLLGWLTANGLVVVVGPAAAGCDALASRLAARAADAGRRVYRLGLGDDAVEGAVSVARTAGRATALELRAIGGQCPDVVETGLLAGAESWNAALDLAHSGALVIARSEAADGAEAVSSIWRVVADPAAAAALCLGTVTLRAARLSCTACPPAPDAAEAASECPNCRGTGLRGAVHLAEVLDFRGPLGQRLAERDGASEIRAAATALGVTTLDERGRDLVRRGLTNEREVARALAS
ncbi:MAG: hypothetical protein NTY35_16185 [Planctomycetota bacterium]|nr:hypothetical protein [Planctomycetota bacterium]